MKITFLGAGAYGTALSSVATYNGHEVNFYDPIKFPDVSIESAISGADVIVYTAPSDQAAQILPDLNSDTPLICASKGFLSQAPFKEFKVFSVLSGAGFADDIRATIDSPDSHHQEIRLTGTSDLVNQIFSTEHIVIEHTTDVIGVLLCGALKNIYAIGAGYYSDKPSTIFLEKVLREMADLLEANHADKNTLRLSCGAADLVLTCSDNSRNFRDGQSLKNPHRAATAPNSPLTEGVSAILHLSDYPDFIIPEDATIIGDIIKLVKKSNAKKEEHAA